MPADSSPLGGVDLREVIAAIEHERWSHWQRYLHEQCAVNEDGSLTIPAELAARWARQMNTPYDALTEKEKDSDREQADAYLRALRPNIGRSNLPPEALR